MRRAVAARSRGRRRCFALVLVGATTLAAACAELPSLDDGACGNRVVDVELGEDCDTHAVEPGTSCATEAPNACRYTCEPGGTPACPSWMGCGADGLCRSSTGRFAQTAEIAAPGARELSIANLDGDRGGELVVAGEHQMDLHYFGAGGEPIAAPSFPIESRFGAVPAAGDLSGDGRLDLVTPVGNGIVTNLGTAAPGLFPTAYPVLTNGQLEEVRAYLMEVIPALPGDELVIVATAIGTSAIAYADGTTLKSLAALPAGPSQLAGEVRIGSIDEDPASSPCEELALAFRSSSTVRVYTPCRVTAADEVIWNDQEPLHAIALPAGATVERGPLLHDLNGDGHLDLVVEAAGCAGCPEIEVAYGLGDGSFHSNAAELPPAVPDDAFASYPAIPAPLPLALGDLDGDGAPDWVDATSVRVSGLGPAGYGVAAAISGGAWTEAVIADFNANGVPDVVAGSNAASGVHFYNGVGDGKLNPYLVPTTGPVVSLAPGDFDGDLVLDLALGERGAGGGEPLAGLGDSVSILFGRSAGAPEPPLSMGRFDAIQQIGPGDTPTQGILDGITDLQAISLSPDGFFSFGGFAGRSDRLLRSPFVMTRQDLLELVADFPERLVLGELTGDDHPDVAALTKASDTDGSERLWLVPSVGEARLDLVEAAPSDPLPPGVLWSESAIATVDLDADGVDELVLVAPAEGGDGAVVAIARAVVQAGRHWAIDPPAPLGASFRRVEVFEGTPSPNGRLVAADLDRDGDRDVVVLAGSEVLVLDNGGAGALGAPVRIAAPGGAAVLDVAVLQADADRELELALLLEDGVHLADRGASGGLAASAAPAIAVEGGHLVAAGDLDGDGVDDVAVAGPERTSIWRGEAVHP